MIGYRKISFVFEERERERERERMVITEQQEFSFSIRRREALCLRTELEGSRGGGEAFKRGVPLLKFSKMKMIKSETLNKGGVL